MESPSMSSISILAVEDEAITLEFFFITLVKKYPGYHIYKALNGKSGLELFKTHTPDIVITDLSMPEISGMQMVGEIRAIKPDTKFIIVTGDMGKLTEEAGKDGLETELYISKPVDFIELFTAIEKCVAEIRRSSANLSRPHSPQE